MFEAAGSIVYIGLSLKPNHIVKLNLSKTLIHTLRSFFIKFVNVRYENLFFVEDCDIEDPSLAQKPKK